MEDHRVDNVYPKGTIWVELRSTRTIWLGEASSGRTEISLLKWTQQLWVLAFSSHSLLADFLEASASSSLVALKVLDHRLTIRLTCKDFSFAFTDRALKRLWLQHLVDNLTTLKCFVKLLKKPWKPEAPGKELREELQGSPLSKNQPAIAGGDPSVTSRNEPISRRDSLSHPKETTRSVANST